MSILKKQPIFKLNVATFGTKHIININGVSLLSDLDKPGQSETTLPLNHLMRSGTNILELYIFPDTPKQEININSRAKLSLNVTSNTNTDETFYISDIVFEGHGLPTNTSTFNSSKPAKLDSSNEFKVDQEGDTEIFNIKIEAVPSYKGAIKITREIYIPSSLPLWAFFNSEKLPDYDSMTDDEYYIEVEKLLHEYLKVQNALKTKNIKSIIDIFKERNNELDMAFYQPPGTYDSKIFNSLTDAANDENLILVGLKKENVNFTVEDNKKLTSLTRDDFKPAISLNFKSGTGSQNYPLIFRLSNGNWVLTR